MQALTGQYDSMSHSATTSHSAELSVNTGLKKSTESEEFDLLKWSLDCSCSLIVRFREEVSKFSFTSDLTRPAHLNTFMKNSLIA